MTRSPLTFVLADDHGVVRAGIRRLLEDVEGWRVVAECVDADDAARAVYEHHPDVLVLDLIMPGRPSLDVLTELHHNAPETHVVMLTMSEDPAIARAAIAAGCSAYVLKESSDAELVEAVARTAAGGSYLDPTIGAVVAGSGALPRAQALSDRETEVLRLIALGNTNTEIADTLSLSVRTVETHRARIQSKTGAKTRSELVAFALRAGLLDAARNAHRSTPPQPRTEV